MSDTLGHDGPGPAGDGGMVMITVNGRRMHIRGNISVAVLLESRLSGPRDRRGVEPIGAAPIRLADVPFRWRSPRRAHGGTGWLTRC
jgi:hypothetical protein